MNSKGTNDLTKYIKVILFVGYSLIMLYLLLGRSRAVWGENYYWRWIKESLNLIPFRTILEFIHTINTSTQPYLIRHSFINLAGNVVMFIPFGFFMPWLFAKCRQYRWTVLCTGVTIILIEMIQLFTLRGSCDIDDLILNLFGVTLGYGLFMLIAKSIRKKRISAP